MKARFVMNNSNDKKNTSEISQDMLILNGELKSGMEKENSSYYYNKNSDHHRSPQHNTPQGYNRQSYGRMSNGLDNLEPVNDEMRKRPFTVPIVRVEINCENPMDNSTLKTKQSRVSYTD